MSGSGSKVPRNPSGDSAKAAGVPHELLAHAAHELRSPLGTVLGWAHMLRRRGGDEEFLHGLDVIEQSVLAQTRLLDNLLDSSRILSGELRLNLRAVEPRRIVDEALEVVHGEAEARSVRISKVLDLTVAPVQGDAARLQQVLVILLSNAVKFTPENGAVEVAVQHAGAQAEISVKDSGRGWDSASVPHAFDTLSGGTVLEGLARGHGLGLTVARLLVELHGGTTSASSPGEGRGATFAVQLPLAT